MNYSYDRTAAYTLSDDERIRNARTAVLSALTRIRAAIELEEKLKKASDVSRPMTYAMELIHDIEDEVTRKQIQDLWRKHLTGGFDSNRPVEAERALLILESALKKAADKARQKTKAS